MNNILVNIENSYNYIIKAIKHGGKKHKATIYIKLKLFNYIFNKYNNYHIY